MEIDEQRQTKQINTSSNLDLSIDRQTQRGAGAAQQAAATTTNNGSIELQFDEDRLKIYYERIFPYKLMFKWISYNKMVQRDNTVLTSLDDGTHSTYFHQREFSFTLANDVYCRYLCFKNAESFRQTLVDRVPYKIDIGAVYNIAPDRHNASDKKAFVPMQKEMVFDIDMNDYDDVRTCCQGANVCERCFAYLKIAMRVISDILNDDFDFSNLLWVFSGRRGIHAWVCDEEARAMTNEMRSAVINYCNIGVGNENANRLQLDYPLHPRLRKAYNYLKEKFVEVIIGDHELLRIETHREKMLQFLPYTQNDELRKKVRNLWVNRINDETRSSELWEIYLEQYSAFKDAAKFKVSDLSIEALVLTYLYPRIDVNVSTGINHLLKSPWCVHPKTGKICVPIDPRNPDAFDCTNVPTLTSVINELGSMPAGQRQQEEGDSTTPPCLEAYMQTFRQFLDQSKRQQLNELRQANRNKAAAQNQQAQAAGSNIDF